MYSCAPSDNSAYDKGYDTGFNAGYEDGLKKAEEQNQQALEEAIELGYQEGKEKYLKEKREIEARKSENGDYIPPGNAEEKGNEVEQEKEYDHSTNLEASLEIKATATPIKLIS